MDRSFVFILIIILLIGGTSFYFYKTKKTNIPSSIETPSVINRSIFIQGYIDDNSTELPFDLYLDSVFYQSYRTQAGVYMKIDLPINQTLTLFSRSLKGYNKRIMKERDFLAADNQKIDLNITSFPIIQINQSIPLQTGRNLYVYYLFDKPVTSPIFCITWSPRILRVTSDMQNTSILPEYSGKVDKCFASNQSDISYIPLSISYETVAPLTPGDFIDVIFIDTDLCYNSGNFSQCSYNGGDVGLRNPTYRVT